MTWTVLNFPYQSILSAAKMTHMQANFTAFADGDSGAPKVKKAALTAGIVDFASKIEDTAVDDTWSLAAFDTMIVPAGSYNISCATASPLTAELYVDSSWKYYFATSNPSAGYVVSNGSNVRLHNTNSIAVTAHYRRLFS